MNRRLSSIFLLLLATSLMTGCGERLPDGMPRLYPASITVTQEGTPLAEAVVQLVSEDPANASWGAGGTTNESGIAVLRTNGKYNGAPLGTYKVTVSKMEQDPHPNPELKGGGEDEVRRYLAVARTLRTYRLIEPQYSSLNDTPLRVEIIPNERTYAIDAGKKIRVVVRLMQ